MTATANASVPAYLGRILDAGVPIGTCFQVGGSILVTAWHVFVEAAADDIGMTVTVDGLAAGAAEPVNAVCPRAEPPIERNHS